MTEPTDAELEALAVEHEAFGFGLADKQGLSTHGFDPDGLRSFARAVLAEWGTPPAVEGEPVAHDEDLLEQLYWDFDSQRKKTGEERLAFKGKMRSYASEFRRRSVGQMVFAQSVSDDMMNLADRLGDLPYVDPRAWRHLLVYAPQQEAVPLTDEQAKALLKNSDLLDMFLHIGWYSAPRKNFDAHGLTLIRAIEAAHGIGIKGGQHG